MKGISVKYFKIILNTAEGEYGFRCNFKDGLNIIRGDNSSGKSTLVNCLFYSIGMEELIGGRGTKYLPYALKTHTENQSGQKNIISSSYVFVEVENKLKECVTFKRSINSSEKDSKLIEVIKGPYISNPDNEYEVIPTFLHDKGSAQNNAYGFFTYLENFMSLNLPKVTYTNGNEAKLYLQTIFSAHLIEQKRGWTDYIANTPYYALRDVRTKIVQFILGLDVFENERKRSKAISDKSEIEKQWKEEKYAVTFASEKYAITASGIKSNADDSFDPSLAQLTITVDGESIPVTLHIVDLINKIEEIDNEEKIEVYGASTELVDSYTKAKNELATLISLSDTANAELRLAKGRLHEYTIKLHEVEQDLQKNKFAKKLKSLGAEQNLQVASDSCPSCHQHI